MDMDSLYVKRALELAKLGEGFTNPNPLVGAVIVKDGKIIGEGYHEKYGGPHAEINAFKNSVDSVEGADMYVTLEPCSHYGKTPPCAEAIVKNKIKRVVIAMKDPNPVVSGRGIEILKENGIEVKVGILEEESKKLNEVFIKYITTQIPFCILKTAMTLDGKIASCIGDSKWITNDLSRKYVHKIRNKVSAIMVGIGTVLIDNPNLTTRIEDENISNVVRIIVDSKAKIPLNSNVLNCSENVKTIVAVTSKAPKDKILKIEEKGAEVIVIESKESRVNLKELMKKLGSMGIDSVLLEGGSTLNYSALNEGVVDKVMSFIAPKIVGGENSKTPIGGCGIELVKDAIEVKNINLSSFGEDILIEGYVKGSFK